MRYLSAHSVCAWICVYLSSDFCNPCFSSVSSSSGAVRINSPHFFPYTSLSLTFSSSFSFPEARCLGQLCIYSSVCSFVTFVCISLPHTQTRTHTDVLLSEVEISQSIGQSPFSVVRQTEGGVLNTLVHMSLLTVFISFSDGRLHLFNSLTVMHSHSEPSSHSLGRKVLMFTVRFTFRLFLFLCSSLFEICILSLMQVGCTSTQLNRMRVKEKVETNK